jgi:hypothetical protein
MAAPIIVRPVIRTPERRTKDRDWVAFVISMVSFVISILSFFFSTLLEVDDIRVVIHEVPYLDGKEDGTLSIYGGAKFAFMNSGNRPGSILAVNAIARTAKKDEGANAKCLLKNELTGIPLIFGIDPFVLEPGKITNVQSSKISGWGIDPINDEPGTYSMDKNVYSPKGGDVLLICIQATIATPIAS